MISKSSGIFKIDDSAKNNDENSVFRTFTDAIYVFHVLKTGG
jgi:hypothetical protein